MSRIGESLGKRKKEEKDFSGESRVSETLTKAEKNNKYSNSSSRIGRTLASATFTDAEKRARSINVDEDYINSYISDVNKFYESAQNNAKSNSYSNAKDTANFYSDQWGKIEKKSGNIRAYLNRNKNNIPEETYTSLMNMLNENKKKTSDVSQAFQQNADYYGQFESEAAYKKAVEVAEQREKEEKYDLTSGKEELDALKTIKKYNTPSGSQYTGFVNSDEYEKAKKTLKKYGIDDVSKVDINKLTTEKEQAYNLASATQSANKLRENALNAEDFNEYGDFSKYGGKGIIGKDAVVKSDLLTDEEKSIWAYYYNKKDYKTANDYLSSIQAEINEREGQQLFKDKLEGKTAKELSFSTLAGLDTARSGMQNTVNYLFNEKPSAPSAYQYASQLARADMEDVGDNVSVSGNSLGGAAYDFNLNLWNQVPQILAASMTGSPAAGLATMGTSVFGNAYSQMSELGYGKEDSTKYAVINTALELGLEKVLGGFAAFGKGALSPALSKVAGKISDRVPGVALKLISKYGGKIGADMLSEFTEESLQEILDPLVQTYTTHGSIAYTPTQISDALYAGLLGALSAGTMNAPMYVSEVNNTRKLGKSVKGNVQLTQGLMDTAFDSSNKSLAYQYASRLVNKASKGINTDTSTDTKTSTETTEPGTKETVESVNANPEISAALASQITRKTSALKLGLLYHEVSAEMSNDTKQAFVENLKKRGYLQDSAEITADALSDLMITGDARKFNGLILDNEIVNEAALETIQGAINDTFDSSPELQRRMSAFENVQRGITTGLKTGTSTTMTPNTDVDIAELEKKLVPESVQDTVAEKVTEKPVPKVASFVNLNQNTKTVKLDNGETVNLSNVEYGSDSEGLLIEGIADMGVNSATANLLMRSYDGDNSVRSVSTYLNDVKRAYNAGLINYPLERMHNFSTDGTKVRSAWQAGQIQAKFDKVKSRVTPEKPGLYKNGQKTTAKEIIKNYKGLNEVQKTSLEVLERLSEALDSRIEVFESKVEDGRRVGENGKYHNGTIYVDLYAGESGSGTMLRTVSHEMVHMIKDYSREHFDTLADYVIKTYANNAVDVEELVERQQMIAKSDPTFDGELSYEAAFEEVVAESLERMLTDTDALTKIEELARKDKPLVQKMSDFVKKVLNKIKAIYKAYNGESYAVRNGLQDVVDEFQKLSDVFAEGVANASKNIKTERNNTATKESSGEVKYSNRVSHTAQDEITAKYQKDVDDVLNMRNTSRNNLVIGYTPEIMQKMKMPALPFVIGTGHVYSAAKTETEARQDGNYKKGVHYHGLGETAVKNIYEKLQDPVMIIAAKDVDQNAVPLRSTHSVVAIVDVGQGSKSLLLPVEITAERTVNGERMDVNVLSSVYNKNVTNLVNESIALENSGDIGVYYAKKEASTLIGAGVQFPVQLQKKMASNPIIRSFDEKINMKISDVTQSLQFKRWFGKSKVVNKDGTPRVVYHFTDADITQFDVTKSGSNQGMTHGDGIYLSTSPTEYSYAGSNRMDLYAAISKPFEMSLSKSQAQKIYDKYFRPFHEDKFHTYEPHVLDALQSSYKVFDYLKEAAEKNNTTTSAILSELGYDGVHDGIVWVAFEPAQVKSATDNVGTFARNNPDIRYSRRDVFGFEISKNATVDEDVLEELSIHDPNAKVDENGNITVYHRTTPENARAIRETGVMTALEDALFFSSEKDGEYNSDYGEAVIELSVPSTVLEVNDIFDGEVHFDIPLTRRNNQWQLNVSKYLVDSDNSMKFSRRDIVGTSGTNYGTGVYLDSTKLDGLSDSERINTVKDFVNSLGGQTLPAYDSNGNKVEFKIAKKTDKFVNKNYKKVPATKDLKSKYINNKTKQEAIVLIDELVSTAKYAEDKASSYPHGWLDNYGKNDWEYWKTYIQDKNKTVWEATLNVTTTTNGEKVLYDIYPIKKVEGAVKSAATTTTTSISSTPENVNTKYSLRDNTFSKALTSEEWKKYNNSMTTGVDAGLRINDNSTLVECENGDFEYKYVIYDNEVEDKQILAVYGIRTNYDRATTREIAEDLYALEEMGYAEGNANKILNRIAENYEALLGRYSSKNSRFVRSRRWNIGIGEVNGEGTSGEGVSEGVKYSRRDQFARDLKREYKYTDTVENVAKQLDSIEEMQANATSSKDYQAAYDSAHALAENIIKNGQIIDDESLEIRKRMKNYLSSYKFYVDETLKSEMVYEYGSWANFQKEMRSRGIKFTTKQEPGVFSLDSYWEEIANEFTGILSKDVNALEQPIALANALDAYDGRAELNLVETTEYINGIADDIMAQTAPQPVLINRRTGQAFDNRTLLVNALESAAKTDGERNLLNGYKENIGTLIELQDELAQTNAEIKRLSFAPGKRDTAKIMELQKDANRLGIRIGQTDRKLLQIEAMDSIKNLLSRERATAYKKAKEEGKKALEEYRQREMDKYNELVLKNRAQTRKNVENRKRTELKHKILRQVNKLNSLLLNETKDKHVPISLKPLTASALSAINTQMSNTDAQLEAKLKEIEAAKTPEKKAQLQEQYDRMLLKNENMKERLEALRTAYAEIKNMPGDMYDSDIANQIDSVISDVGDTPLREMSLPQLEKVHDMYTMIQHTISNANKMHKAARNQTVRDTAESFVSELKTKDTAYAFMDKLRATAYNEDKPIYFFRRIGSKTGIQLFKNILEAQDLYGKRAQATKNFVDKVRNKYGWHDWDLDERKTVTANGKTFDISVGELMSVYALSKRDQAINHLEKGGISFTDKPFKKKGKKAKMIHRNPVAYRLGLFDRTQLANLLTEKQRQYVDDVQKFMSNDLSAWGNEASRELWGIDKFKEENYFPINVDKQYMFKDAEALQGSEGIHSMRHAGITKNLIKNASAPVIISDFDSVFAKHTGEMILWSSFVLPVDDFARVYSFTDYWNNEDYSSSVQTVLKGAYGEGATKYVKNLINDINGNTPMTAGTNKWNLLATFKKTAVAASASVIIQQPTAIMRAMAYIDPKYFAHSPKNFSETYQEIKKYAGVAVLKEIGGFDMGSNRQFETWFNAKEYHGADNKAKALIKDSNYRDEVLMSGAGKADELGWAMIWNACLDEVATEKGLTGEDLKIEAGKRFDEVINLTQVYDSVLSRSGYMRDSSELVKMATAFMGEPTTSFNMLTDAIRESARGNITKAEAGRVVGSIFAAQIMAAIFKSIVGANRDDDDEKDWISKYATTVVGNLSPVTIADNKIPFIPGDKILLPNGELNPLTWLPWARDLVSMLQGYSIERTDLSPLTDLFDAFQDLGKDSKSTRRKTEDLIGSVGNIFGIPAKNLLRTEREIRNGVVGIKGLFTGNIPTGEDLKEAAVEGLYSSEVKKSDRLVKAIQDGDSEAITRARSYYEPSDEDLTPDEVRKKTNASIRSSLTSKYKKEYQKAWKKNDEKTMREIREILWGSKAYDSMSDVVDKTSKWIKDIKDEE